MAGINKCAEQARTGELPVVKVIKGGWSEDGYRTKKELDGWNPYLVRKFLKPDRIRQNMREWENRETWAKQLFSCGYEYEYSPEQVGAVEATPEWQKAKAKADVKEARWRKRMNCGELRQPLDT
jgi:hypothetical protein